MEIVDKKVRAAMVFQFHYGSIKIQLISISVRQIKRFQFHYGSIKILVKSEREKADMCFNSTMVRLKSQGERAAVAGS